jgi:hypothetical protein
LTAAGLQDLTPDTSNSKDVQAYLLTVPFAKEWGKKGAKKGSAPALTVHCYLQGAADEGPIILEARKEAAVEFQKVLKPVIGAFKRLKETQCIKVALSKLRVDSVAPSTLGLGVKLSFTLESSMSFEKQPFERPALNVELLKCSLAPALESTLSLPCRVSAACTLKNFKGPFLADTGKKHVKLTVVDGFGTQVVCMIPAPKCEEPLS